MNSGNRLKKLREKQNLTLRELSQITGISKATLSRYENNGMENVPMDKIQILATKLDSTTDYLLGLDSDHDSSIESIRKLLNKKKSINVSSTVITADVKKMYLELLKDNVEMKSKKINDISSKLSFLTIQSLDIINIFVSALIQNGNYVDSDFKESINELLNYKKDHNE